MNDNDTKTAFPIDRNAAHLRSLWLRGPLVRSPPNGGGTRPSLRSADCRRGAPIHARSGNMLGRMVDIYVSLTVGGLSHLRSGNGRSSGRSRGIRGRVMIEVGKYCP